MGGSHNSASSVINKDASLKKYSEQDTSVHINNRHGEHNIEVGRLGDGGIIFLQNLNQMQQPQQQMQLQNLALYVPQTNQLMLLNWEQGRQWIYKTDDTIAPYVNWWQ